mgnify:CR=1 FL=1
MQIGLNPFERTILGVLGRGGRPLTTRQVAQFSGMSWLTAKKYLNELNSRGRVEREKRGKSIYWELTKEGTMYSTLRGLS